MSKYNIGPQLECQNRILNVKIRYSTPVGMSKQDFECENTIFRCQNTLLGSIFKCQETKTEERKTKSEKPKVKNE